MICLLHGYLLDGSGSNLWTRSILRAMCRTGETVHLMCQEPHPEHYDFIAAAYAYEPDGTVCTLVQRDVPYTGRCIMHKPILGDTLPVYVWDAYEEFAHAVPMTELGDVQLEDYLHRNVTALLRIIREHGITVVHANHAVLMSVVAQRAKAWTGVPYAIMPHGSALEYAVKPDVRMQRLGADAFAHAQRLIVISSEVAARVQSVFGGQVPDLAERMSDLDLGVDTAAFVPVEPAARPANVAAVNTLLEGLPRGRSPAQAAALHHALDAGAGPAAACAAVGEFTAKYPDVDVELKLDTIDWETSQVMAFIGRLIPAKGIHAVIGALPLILPHAPRLRLLVVGHGPLRDVLEALLHAMQRGDRALAADVLQHAAATEGVEAEHLEALPWFWRQLEEQGQLEAYWAAAARLLKPDTVVFTGYMTHREMSVLLPCCDAAIFPSMVIESGPLVFLEALASGVFPIGTYFGGMKVKIDRVLPELAEDVGAAMKVRPEAEHIVRDIAAAVPAALRAAGAQRHVLRRVAEDHYDWRPLARRLSAMLEATAVGADGAAAPTNG